MERESDKMKKLVNVKIEFKEGKFFAIETYELLVRPSTLLRQILKEDGLLGKLDLV